MIDSRAMKRIIFLIACATLLFTACSVKKSLPASVSNVVDDRLSAQLDTGYKAIGYEEPPIEKSDIAQMERLFIEAEPGSAPYTKFTKWAHIFVDDKNEWIWAVEDEASLSGAIFLRKDGMLKLVARTGPNLKPAIGNKDGLSYLAVGGSAGGPSWYREIYVFRDGLEVERLYSLEVYGQMEECSLNGKPLSAGEWKAYLQALPIFEGVNPCFNSIKTL